MLETVVAICVVVSTTSVVLYLLFSAYTVKAHRLKMERQRERYYVTMTDMRRLMDDQMNKGKGR